MNLYKQVNNWFMDEQIGYIPFFNNWLYFNATPFIVGAVSFNSVPGDRVVKEYIEGTKVKELILAIDFVTQYDLEGTSDINMDIMEEVENFNKWVEDRNINKQFPDFGENNIVTSVVSLSDTPSMLVDSTQNLAKYQIQIKINYNDESEVIK